MLKGHTDILTSVDFSPDGGRVVTAACDNTARVWDAAIGKELAVLAGHEDQLLPVAFSPDGGAGGFPAAVLKPCFTSSNVSSG